MQTQVNEGYGHEGPGAEITQNDKARIVPGPVAKLQVQERTMRLGCAEKPRPPRAQARRSSQMPGSSFCWTSGNWLASKVGSLPALRWAL